ncbi:MAG: DUF4097 family beta strand repeat protein [Acidobacteria bacterium]|nr:DUF4097 family beta strand repeat protein [Acidobacteriota bacterium]
MMGPNRNTGSPVRLTARFAPLLLGLGFLLTGLSPTFAAKKLKPVTLPDFTGWMTISKDLEKPLKFYPGGMINIDTGFMGNLTIEGGLKPEVMIRATITAYGKTQEETLANFQEIYPRINRTETVINITTTHPEKFDRGKIDYHLVVPKYRTDMKIFTNRGFISIRDLNGWIEADTAKGYLQLNNLSGYISCKTLEGDIQAQLKGKRWEGLQLSAVTDKGDVKVFMPAEYHCDLTLITLRGSIEVDYPTYLVDEEESGIGVAKKKDGACISQQVRDGGPCVVIQTGCGQLTLQQYDPEKEFLDHAPAEESVPSPPDKPGAPAPPGKGPDGPTPPDAPGDKEKNDAPDGHR